MVIIGNYGDKINNKTIQDHKYATPREKTYRDLKEYRDIVNLTQYGQGLSLTNGDTVYKFFNAVTEYETHFSDFESFKTSCGHALIRLVEEAWMHFV